MAESYSIKAILSAKDSGFTSTMKSAGGALSDLKSQIAGGLGFGVLSGVGQAAFSAVTGSVKQLFGEAMETSDAMQKLQQAMAFDGVDPAEIERIAGSTGTLKTYADKTVFSLQDVMSTFGALSANGVKDADKMTEAVGNAVAVFGGGAQEFSSVALAFSQSMAAGKMNAQDWNQILNASPQLAGGLKKELQKLNPVLAKDFKGAMEDGAITAELLGKAMNTIGMTEMAKEAATSVKTWEGAMGNLEATVSGGLMTLWDSFAKTPVIDAVNALNGKLGSVFETLQTAIPAAIEKVTPYSFAASKSILLKPVAKRPIIFSFFARSNTSRVISVLLQSIISASIHSFKRSSCESASNSRSSPNFLKRSTEISLLFLSVVLSVNRIFIFTGNLLFSAVGL